VNEIGEMWKAWRAEKAEARADRRDEITDRIRALARDGYEVRMISTYQFRINNWIDLYPTNCRYHNLRTNDRGWFSAGTMRDVVDKQLTKARRNDLRPKV
jgi:hypothetical protein